MDETKHKEPLKQINRFINVKSPLTKGAQTELVTSDLSGVVLDSGTYRECRSDKFWKADAPTKDSGLS